MHHLDTWPSKRVHALHREYIICIIWMHGYLKESTPYTVSTCAECEYITEQSKEGHGFYNLQWSPLYEPSSRVPNPALELTYCIVY